jgi:hypothetical protein
LHHALTRREAALQRDPSGLMQRFATCALFGVGALDHGRSPLAPVLRHPAL